MRKRQRPGVPRAVTVNDGGRLSILLVCARAQTSPLSYLSRPPMQLQGPASLAAMRKEAHALRKEAKKEAQAIRRRYIHVGNLNPSLVSM